MASNQPGPVMQALPVWCPNIQDLGKLILHHLWYREAEALKGWGACLRKEMEKWLSRGPAQGLCTITSL